MESEQIVKRGPGRPAKAPTVNDIDTMRDDIRHDLRESDPHAAAIKRAEEIKAQLGDSIDTADEFFIPDDLKHSEWTMEWKRWSVYNAEDSGYINGLLRTGWDFVPASRAGFEIFLPRGWKENFILKKGMVLMERPREITDMIESRQLQEARAQVQRKEQQLGEAPAGTLPRADSTGRQVGSHGVSGAKRTISGPIPN